MQRPTVFGKLEQEGLWKGRWEVYSSVSRRGIKKKKKHMWELWVKFYLGQNEDYHPGDSPSGSSETLLQKGR